MSYSCWCDIYRPSRKLRECNVFSRVCPSVILSRGGSSCEHCPWCIWPHCTAPHPLELGPPHQPIHVQTWSPLLVTPGSHHWRPVQTSSLEDIPPSPVLPSGGHRSMCGWEVGSTHPTATELDMKTQSQVEEKNTGEDALTTNRCKNKSKKDGHWEAFTRVVNSKSRRRNFSFW